VSLTGFPLTWKVRELIWSAKVREIHCWSGKNGVYPRSCATVVL